MIEYEHVKGRRGSWQVKVKLDGKVVGAIKITEGGFAYFPNGSRKGFAPELFKSVREVQRSLETQEEEGN